MDRVMYILVVAMLLSWLILILHWRYVQGFRSFIKDMKRVSCRIKQMDFSVRLKKVIVLSLWDSSIILIQCYPL